MSEPVTTSVEKGSGRVKMSLVRRFFMIFACILSLMLLSLWGLPTAMEYAAASWLQKHGVKDAAIENIDLNLFRGTCSIEGLRAGEGLNVGHFSMQIDWQALLNHVVHIRALQVNKVAIDLTQKTETWQLADIQIPESEVDVEQNVAEDNSDKPWLIIIDDLVLSELDLRVTANDFSLDLPVKSLKLSLSGLHDNQQKIVHDIELGPTTFSGFKYKVNYQHLNSTGETSLSLLSSDLLQSMQSRKLALDLAELKVANDTDKALLSLLSLQLADVDVRGGKQFIVGSVDMHEVHVDKALTGNGAVALDRLHAEKIDVDMTGTVDLSTLKLDALSADGFAGDDHLRVKQLALSGFARAADETLSLGSLELQNSEFKQGKQSLGSIGHTTLERFSMRGVDTGAFKLLKLDAVQLPSNAQGNLGTIGSIQADTVMLDHNGLYRAKQLRFDDVNTTIVIQKDGTLAVLDAISKSQLASTAKPSTAKGSKKRSASSAGKAGKELDSVVVKKEPAKEPVVMIDEFIISAGSHIALHDLSVVPALNTEMRVQHFRFAPLDSSGKQAGQLDMQMQMGKSGALKVKGELLPAAGDALRTDLNVELKNYDLARLSGYIETDFGKSIKTGQFNLNSSMKIAKGSLDAKNRVLIRQLELGDSKQPGKPDMKLGMPVGAALNMLRDGRGDIDLEVPVSGKLDDPDISLNAIINKALLSSLSTGAMTYATLILQPYGSIILAADLASDLIAEAVKPKLTPVIFEELQTTLNPDMQDYVTKIAALLIKSDEFRLQICGVATRIEGEPVPRPPAVKGEAIKANPPQAKTDAALLHVGQLRSDAVMSALQAKGVTTDRLFTCRSNIDEAKLQAQPRVELILN
ncbi:MAG: DUF748 domain-containing protein [Mariprofundus sp.]|nr:DUF748 domain-containing protein [Mariprofundus sp.]